ncbi:MAG: alpha/beta fold hydrolase [Terracidiphilus sp.]|jgi:surfactin synthase thioesterase subunit
MAEWFTSFREVYPAPTSMFCFPYVGGGAGVFRSWAEHFGDRVKVQALLLPGRERRLTDEPLVDTLAELVDLIAPAFKDFNTPFVFFGHSMGGLIAFELTRELRRRKWPIPLMLFASACSAPQIPDYVVPPRSTLLEEEIVAELRRLNGTDEAVLGNEVLRSLLLPALRADFNIVDRYRYCEERPLDCPIVTLGGIHDPGISLDMLAGWQLQTTRGFELQMFNGDHFYLNRCRDPLLKTIERELTRCNHLR